MTTWLPRLVPVVLSVAISACSGGAKGSGGTAGTAGGGTGGGSVGGGAGAGGNMPDTGGATAGGGTTGIGGAGPGGSTGTPSTAGALGSTVGSLELYGTFHAMGVIATLPAGTDANSNAVANLEYRVSGTGDYLLGFPLTSVAATSFVGSLFWLTPGTSYDVRVRYADPDGAPLDGAGAGATASTRAEISIPSPTRTLQVSPTGSGTVCSAATPCPLSQALGQAQAGDEVLLAAGTYYQGEFTISASGTAAAPISIRGATGAILDGADPATFTWQDDRTLETAPRGRMGRLSRLRIPH